MKVQKWLGHEFESSCSRTPEYLQWHRDLKSTLKTLLPSQSELLMSKPNHFDASGFIKRGEKFVYFSMCDIRDTDRWFNNILVRTAKHDKDYTGGHNNYTTLDRFTDDVERLLGV